MKLGSKNISQSIGSTVVEDIIDQETGEIFMEGGSELTQEIINSLKGVKNENDHTFNTETFITHKSLNYKTIIKKKINISNDKN